MELYDPPVAVNAQHDVGPHPPVNGYPGGYALPVLRNDSRRNRRAGPHWPEKVVPILTGCDLRTM
jgi:hypothetical protein